MTRSWQRPAALGCVVVPAVLIATLILTAIGSTFVTPVVTALFPPTAADLTRTFTCRYPYATETLTLEADGTFVQRIVFDSGRAINNTGRWTFDRSQTEVRLGNATVVDNAFGAPAATLAPTSALWIMPARRSVTGRSYLVVNEDVDLYLK